MNLSKQRSSPDIIFFSEKLNANLANNKFYQKSRSSADSSFSVRHYAGRVQYQVKGFLEKNKSFVSTGMTITSISYSVGVSLMNLASVCSRRSN